MNKNSRAGPGPQRFLRPRVAISACLYGERVRYDGASKAQPVLITGLRDALELVPLCPETGAGLGVPRPPVQLILDGAGQLRMTGRDQPALDVTEAVQTYSAAALDRLLAEGGLCGWIFKSRSPSCGFGSTPHYSAQSVPLYHGDGMQAALVRQRAPWIVAREETGLADARRQREFIALCRLVWSLCHRSGMRTEAEAAMSAAPAPRIANSAMQPHRRLLDWLFSRDSARDVSRYACRHEARVALESGHAHRYCAALLACLSTGAAGEEMDDESLELIEAIADMDDH